MATQATHNKSDQQSSNNMTANTVQVALATMCTSNVLNKQGHGVGTKVLLTNCMTVHPTYSGNKGIHTHTYSMTVSQVTKESLFLVLSPIILQKKHINYMILCACTFG